MIINTKISDIYYKKVRLFLETRNQPAGSLWISTEPNPTGMVLKNYNKAIQNVTIILLLLALEMRSCKVMLSSYSTFAQHLGTQFNDP